MRFQLLLPVFLSISLSVCLFAASLDFGVQKRLNGSRSLGWRFWGPTMIVLDGGPDPTKAGEGKRIWRSLQCQITFLLFLQWDASCCWPKLICMSCHLLLLVLQWVTLPAVLAFDCKWFGHCWRHIFVTKAVACTGFWTFCDNSFYSEIICITSSHGCRWSCTGCFQYDMQMICKFKLDAGCRIGLRLCGPS